jgi:hypothetical protein
MVVPSYTRCVCISWQTCSVFKGCISSSCSCIGGVVKCLRVIAEADSEYGFMCDCRGHYVSCSICWISSTAPPQALHMGCARGTWAVAGIRI